MLYFPRYRHLKFLKKHIYLGWANSIRRYVHFFLQIRNPREKVYQVWQKKGQKVKTAGFHILRQFFFRTRFLRTWKLRKTAQIPSFQVLRKRVLKKNWLVDPRKVPQTSQFFFRTVHIRIGLFYLMRSRANSFRSTKPAARGVVWIKIKINVKRILQANENKRKKSVHTVCSSFKDEHNGIFFISAEAILRDEIGLLITLRLDFLRSCALR